MSQVEELLRKIIEQNEEQTAHDRTAASNAQQASERSRTSDNERTVREMDAKIRDAREDVTESFFKFATGSMQTLATSPLAAHGLKYITPVFGAVGLIYTTFKKGRLMTEFEATRLKASEAVGEPTNSKTVKLDGPRIMTPS